MQHGVTHSELELLDHRTDFNIGSQSSRGVHYLSLFRADAGRADEAGRRARRRRFSGGPGG
eukprot:14797660-Alexandrium_andersonii.AAC.1